MLKKDMLELFLLKIISNEDKYGYEIIRLLHTTFPDTQESAIYAQLRGLCQQGCGGLAAQGADWQQILNVYYPGCQIENLTETTN